MESGEESFNRLLKNYSKEFEDFLNNSEKKPKNPALYSHDHMKERPCGAYDFERKMFHKNLVKRSSFRRGDKL